MKLFSSNNLSECLTKKYIFVDNDFLSALFHHADFFRSFLSKLRTDFLLYDPFIGFEFLRDVFIPKERNLREDFLGLDLFIPVTNNQQIYTQLQENALVVSKILAINKVTSASSIDLYLIGRIMIYDPKDHILITGNKKDFPSCLFNTKDIVSAYNEKKDKINNFFVVQFNPEKFEKQYKNLLKVEKTNNKKIGLF